MLSLLGGDLRITAYLLWKFNNDRRNYFPVNLATDKLMWSKTKPDRLFVQCHVRS